MPAHILLAALLTIPPTVAPTPKEPAVYATIKLGKKACVWDTQFSTDGKTLAYIESGDRIVQWDVAKKEKTAAFGSKVYYRQMVWAPDGKAIYAADVGGVYRVDVATGKRAELYAHDNEVTTLKYLPDTKQLVSASLDGSIVVWDAAKDKKVKELKCPEDALTLDAQPLPGTSKLVVAAENVILNTGGPTGVTLHGMSESNMEKIRESAKAYGGKVTIEGNKVLYLVDVADGKFAKALDDPPVGDDGRRLAAPHAGGEFAYGDDECRVVFTDAATLKTRTTGKCPIHPSQLLFTPNGRYLIAAGPLPIPTPLTLLAFFTRPSGIAVYDLAAEKWIAYWQVREDWPDCSVSYSEPNNLLACAGRDSVITVWDMKGIIDPAAKKEKK